MAFDERLLHDHEDLVLDLRPHWWFMAKPAAALVGAIVLGALVVTSAGDDTYWDVLRMAVAALVVFCMLWFVLRYAKWVTTNFVVTTDRLVYRVGVVAKSGIEIPLERVNTVFFNQTLFERMLGAGDLSIESGGETGKQSFSDIRKPSLVQNEIYKQMEANNDRMYHGRTPSAPQSAPSSGSDDLAAQLERLDDLRQRGVLTEAEFADAKADILRRP
ncbi:MAG: PH domain-containing protein [Acidimicrobiia bacterium]|jgi:uncharacterized membrane protein YdbT with pleckstrin-like domain|nr:PH domain-containing protein [Acidimicrobiia bacterium]